MLINYLEIRYIPNTSLDWREPPSLGYCGIHVLAFMILSWQANDI